MIQDTGLGQEMFVSAYEKLDRNGNAKLHCYRYTDEPLEGEVKRKRCFDIRVTRVNDKQK